MNYGERLRLARQRAGLTQAELAQRVGIKQPSLAYLENPAKNASGSDFTVKLAKALGVSVDWLDDEIGEMVPTVYSTSDPKLVTIMQALQPCEEYVKDAAVAAVLTTRDLVERATGGEPCAQPDVVHNTVSVSERRLKNAKTLPFTDRRKAKNNA